MSEQPSAADGEDRTDSETELPEAVIDEAEQLTRQARKAVDPNEVQAYREARSELLAEYDYRARVREEDRAVLVCHPDEWLEDGTVVPERIDDLDRGIERPLEGAGDPDDWETVQAHNEEIVADIEAAHGEAHAANAQALAEFMSNHYAKPIDEASEAEFAEFLSEYYPRNVWPTDEQKAVVEQSVQLVREHVDATGTARR